MTSFHNTIIESGDTLVASENNCKTQEGKILQIFYENSQMPFPGLTPFQTEMEYSKLYSPIPITSIRRAISNLTEQNKLIKTKKMEEGQYGKPNFTWVYNLSYGK